MKLDELDKALTYLKKNTQEIEELMDAMFKEAAELQADRNKWVQIGNSKLFKVVEKKPHEFSQEDVEYAATGKLPSVGILREIIREEIARAK